MRTKPSTETNPSRQAKAASPTGPAALADTLAQQYTVLVDEMQPLSSGIPLTYENIKKLTKDLVWCSDEPRTRSTQTERTLELIKSSIPLRSSLFTG